MMDIEDENAALRQRVAELEAALERQHQNAANWAVEQGEQRARAEQTERERDNALAAAGAAREETRSVRDALGRVSRQAELWGEALKTTALARERAEADNAALLRFARDAREAIRTGKWSAYVISEAKRLLEQDHPGAAMLARLRAAEALHPLAAHDEACSVDMGHPASPECCALCAYDTLKERKP